MPIFQTHPIATFPIGNIPLNQHPLPTGLTKHPHAYLSPLDLQNLSTSTHTTLIDQNQTPLAWKSPEPDPTNTLTASTSFLIIHPWELLRANQIHLEQVTAPNILGTIHPSTVIEGIIQLGTGSKILPGVFIEGNVSIGENCKIGPNCYIRGATSIGHHCHIGQAVEIKNSIILSHTSIGHLSYVGDSVIGEKVNFGAGTITSNFRHDGKNHRTMIDGTLIDTGLRKFGSIIGDNVHTGIHTSIYPGRKLHPNTSTRPGEIVQHDITQ